MSVWNGHYDCTCYHPLFLFNQFGDLERSALRPGNVHSADGWHDVLDPVVARYRGKVSRIYFRADGDSRARCVYDRPRPAECCPKVGPKPHDAAQCDGRCRFELSGACRMRRNDAQSAVGRRPSGEFRLLVATEWEVARSVRFRRDKVLAVGCWAMPLAWRRGVPKRESHTYARKNGGCLA